MTSQFNDVATVTSAEACLRDASAKILELYPLTDSNEWVRTPPPEIGEALQLIHAAREHLANLREFGVPGWKLVEV